MKRQPEIGGFWAWVKSTYGFTIGDIVYLKTDPEQLELIVITAMVREEAISINVSHCAEGMWVYPFQLTSLSVGFTEQTENLLGLKSKCLVILVEPRY